MTDNVNDVSSITVPRSFIVDLAKTVKAHSEWIEHEIEAYYQFDTEEDRKAALEDDVVMVGFDRDQFAQFRKSLENVATVLDEL